MGLGVALVLLAVPAPWWLPAALVLVGGVAAGPPLLQRVRRHRELAARRDAGLAERADTQNRWVLRGDNRGVYGPDGAALMRSLTPKPETVPFGAIRAGDVAAIVHTEQDLAVLVRDRPGVWHWAAFGSVLVLRRAAVAGRLRDHLICYAPPDRVRISDEHEVAAVVYRWAEELSDLVEQIQQVMLSRGFQSIFDNSCDEETADADAVIHTAHRLMDLHDRVLELSEHCRALSAPGSCEELLNTFALLVDVPLQGYRRFIDDYVARMAEIPEVLRYARGPVEMDPILLDLEGDYAVMDRFFSQLRAIGIDHPAS